MPAFDADALVALVDQDHEHHEDARALFEQADMVLLHPSVLTEFTTVIRRKAKDRRMDGNRASREAVKRLLAEPRVRIEARLPYDLAVQRFLGAARLSFTDAIVAEMAWHHDCKPPASFDKDLLKEARDPSGKSQRMS